LLARLQQAHADLAEAQAREVDKRGDKVEKQLADHCAKVNALLTQLTELEEGGTFLSTASHTRQVLSLSVMSGGGKTLPPDNLGTVTIPKSERIAQELQGLRQQAAAIRSQRLVTKGRISGYSLEELLDKLRTPNTLAPSESAIRSWFAGQSGKVAQMQTAIAASGENQKVVFVLGVDRRSRESAGGFAGHSRAAARAARERWSGIFRRAVEFPGRLLPFQDRVGRLPQFPALPFFRVDTTATITATQPARWKRPWRQILRSLLPVR
jgi:hypothetical protein